MASVFASVSLVVGLAVWLPFLYLLLGLFGFFCSEPRTMQSNIAFIHIYIYVFVCVYNRT